MNQNKLVSVCIPNYNGENYISKTLESIINQTYKNIEIIISDNCSTDNSCNIIKEYMKKDSRISLNKNDKNLGYSGNLNKLIELANSEYIAIYHADDIYEPTIVEEQIKFLENNKRLAGCFTLANVIDENEINQKNFFVYNKKNLKKNLIVDLDFFIKNLVNKNNIFICPSSMIKKSVYLDLESYDLNIRYIEDQDMWLRILLKYELGIIAKELMNYRTHQMQGSNYYINAKRSKVSESVKNLENFIEKNLKNDIDYQKLLKKMYAKEYCLMALNNLKANNKLKCFEYAERSKKYYKYSIKNKKWIIQNIRLPFIYEVLSFFKL